MEKGSGVGQNVRSYSEWHSNEVGGRTNVSRSWRVFVVNGALTTTSQRLVTVLYRCPRDSLTPIYAEEDGYLQNEVDFLVQRASEILSGHRAARWPVECIGTNAGPHTHTYGRAGHT